MCPFHRVYLVKNQIHICSRQMIGLKIRKKPDHDKTHDFQYTLDDNQWCQGDLTTNLIIDVAFLTLIKLCKPTDIYGTLSSTRNRCGSWHCCILKYFKITPPCDHELITHAHLVPNHQTTMHLITVRSLYHHILYIFFASLLVRESTKQMYCTCQK